MSDSLTFNQTLIAGAAGALVAGVVSLAGQAVGYFLNERSKEKDRKAAEDARMKNAALAERQRALSLYAVVYPVKVDAAREIITMATGIATALTDYYVNVNAGQPAQPVAESAITDLTARSQACQPIFGPVLIDAVLDFTSECSTTNNQITNSPKDFPKDLESWPVVVAYHTMLAIFREELHIDDLELLSPSKVVFP